LRVGANALAQSRAFDRHDSHRTMKIPAAVHALAAVAVLGAGCAAPDDKQQSDQQSEQPEYRTGSNIPKRAARPKTQEERDRAAQDAEQAQRDAEKILRPGG
jgi:hypothetical protein